MKEYLRSLAASAEGGLQAMNVVREYLQARILESMQKGGAMIPLAFHGGTALRFLYLLPRFSEDLGFALEREPERYDLRAYCHTVYGDLSREGYAVELKVSDRRVVHAAQVRFPGLLKELGLSAHPKQVFSVKIEIDTKPPAGAVLERTIVRRHATLQIQHHDRASLLSGKLHALFHRPYAKGRDLYDLFWYLSDPSWPSPNLVLLNHALEQTGWIGRRLDAKSWRRALWRKLESISWKNVASDVRPFLEKASEAEMLTLENLKRMILQPR